MKGDRRNRAHTPTIQFPFSILLPHFPSAKHIVLNFSIQQYKTKQRTSKAKQPKQTKRIKSDAFRTGLSEVLKQLLVPLELPLELIPPLLHGLSAKTLIVVIAIGVSRLFVLVQVPGVLELLLFKLLYQWHNPHVVLLILSVNVFGVQASPFPLIPFSLPLFLNLGQKVLNHPRCGSGIMGLS